MAASCQALIDDDSTTKISEKDESLCMAQFEDLENSLWNSNRDEEKNEDPPHEEFANGDVPFDDDDEEDLRFFIATQSERRLIENEIDSEYKHSTPEKTEDVSDQTSQDSFAKDIVSLIDDVGRTTVQKDLDDDIFEATLQNSLEISLPSIIGNSNVNREGEQMSYLFCGSNDDVTFKSRDSTRGSSNNRKESSWKNSTKSNAHAVPHENNGSYETIISTDGSEISKNTKEMNDVDIVSFDPDFHDNSTERTCSVERYAVISEDLESKGSNTSVEICHGIETSPQWNEEDDSLPNEPSLRKQLVDPADFHEDEVLTSLRNVSVFLCFHRQ